MLEQVSIKRMPEKFKIALLKELGYGSDGKFVLDKNGKKLLDKYTEEPVKINNMFIYPGSTVILDNNALSIASFFEENSSNV